MKEKKNQDIEEVQYSDPKSVKVYAHRISRKQFFVDSDGIVLDYNPRLNRQDE